MRIRVIDLETTGLTPPAEVCEIGYCDLVAIPNSAKENTEWEIKDSKQTFIKPEIPIPPEASAIHHILDEDVTTAPAFSQFISAILDAPKGERLLFCAHNCKFERAWLTDEITKGAQWICTYKCAQRIWPEAPNFSNQTLRYYLKPSNLDRNIAGISHRAYPDAYVTAFILIELLRHASIDELVQWSNEPAFLSRCVFGKHRGKLWKDIESSYLEWILKQDFDEDIVFTATTILQNRKKEPATISRS